jgi:hypothetical protein
MEFLRVAPGLLDGDAYASISGSAPAIAEMRITRSDMSPWWVEFSEARTAGLGW